MHRTSVIRNGQMLGVAEQRSRGTVSSGSMQLLGEAKLQLFYNDGNNVRPTLLKLSGMDVLCASLGIREVSILRLLA